MSKEKVCCVCSRTYEYCGHCDKNAKLNRWKASYCSENCRDIFQILMDYAGKRLPIDVAKQKLSQQNLNLNLGNNVIETFAEIMSYEEPKQEQPQQQESSIEQPKPRRRRRKRIVEDE